MINLGDLNLTINSLLPDEVNVNITIVDITIRPNLITINLIRYIKKSFFSSVLGFTQSSSGVLGDTQGFIQLIPGS